MNTPDTIGTRIRAARLAKKLSQQQLAERIGITRAAVAKWETGASHSVRSHHLDTLARVLGLPVADLLGRKAAVFSANEPPMDDHNGGVRLRVDQWRLLDLWDRIPEADRTGLLAQLAALVIYRAGQAHRRKRDS